MFSWLSCFIDIVEITASGQTQKKMNLDDSQK